MLSDQHTEAAAGSALKEALRRTGRQPAGETVLPAVPRPVPAQEVGDRLVAEMAAAAADVVVAVGGGTLCDLGKYAAHRCCVPVVAVPTAASVDAYTSAKSAMRISGYHRTPPATAPSVILADHAVIRRAPRLLTLAGAGDLIAKLMARFDWELSHLVTGEPFNRMLADCSARAARTALAGLGRNGLTAAAPEILDALLVTGAAMHRLGSSRAAASAEHTIAHLWEVAPTGVPESLDLHGILVGYASIFVAGAYRTIFEKVERARSFSPVNEAVRREAQWRERVPEEMHPYIDKMEEESAGRGLSSEAARQRRRSFLDHREEIVARARPALDEIEQALSVVLDAGFPAEHVQVAPQWVRHAFQWVRYLRNRYSALDLAVELGLDQDVIAQIAPGGDDASGSP